MVNALFGREDFTLVYNNIILSLHTLLETSDLEEFEVNTNVLFENLASGFPDEENEVIMDIMDDNNLYDIFKVKLSGILDDILLKYGVKSEIETIFGYDKIFEVLNNFKNNSMDKKTYELIIHGDYGVEDKLYMLFENFVENPIELIEQIEVSDMFFDKVEELIADNSLNANIDMVVKALELDGKDNRFKETVLFKRIMSFDENIMLSLKLGFETINTNLKSTISEYMDDNDKIFNVNGLILEIAFAYIYYNDLDVFILSNYVNSRSIETTFNIKLSDSIISNVVNTIKIGN